MNCTPRNLPRLSAPEGSVDCHVHVFGPHDRYPLAPNRAYTPAEATFEELQAVMSSAGTSRAVIVHPSAYGADNSLLLSTLERSPNTLRGVVGLPDEIADDELGRMNALGVRGVRINLVSTGAIERSTAQGKIRTTAERIAPLGWHIQVFIRAAEIELVNALLDDLPVPVVFDHMGFPTAEDGEEQPGFPLLVDRLSSGRCWVKLSGPYHVSPHPYGDEKTDKVAKALVAANPDRVVWGSDWPHVGKHRRRPEAEPPFLPHRKLDYVEMISLLKRWTESEEIRRKILVANPSALYGF